MTITSGLAQVGKTHLAVNLALELVRRGRFAGVFHNQGQRTDVSALLELQSLLDPQDEENDGRSVSRQGYQGIDVLGCEWSAGEWAQGDDSPLSQCVGNLDVQEGYDDFLIDTSGMDARTQFACCRVAEIILLVVTPQSCSQVAAFALLRVLVLNGYSGKVYLLVNRSEYAIDSKEIYDDFSRLLKGSLDLESVFLGCVPEDRHVLLAQQYRQAFSSLFPDSEATAGIVAIADVLDDIATPEAVQQSLAIFLDRMFAVMQTPVCLPGGVQLDDEKIALVSADSLPATEREQDGDLSLLQYAGDVPGLWQFLELLPLALQSLGADLGELVTQHGDDSDTAGQPATVVSLLAALLGTFRRALPGLSVELEVTDTFVTGQQPCWLQVGRYLKYVFQLPPGRLPDSVVALLMKLPNIDKHNGAEGEEVYEVLSPAHNSCLRVVSSAGTGQRIQVWLPVVGRDVLAAAAEQGMRVAGIPGKGLH